MDPGLPVMRAVLWFGRILLVQQICAVALRDEFVPDPSTGRILDCHNFLAANFLRIRTYFGARSPEKANRRRGCDESRDATNFAPQSYFFFGRDSIGITRLNVFFKRRSALTLTRRFFDALVLGRPFMVSSLASRFTREMPSYESDAKQQVVSGKW
jgi:hypothetical protein